MDEHRQGLIRIVAGIAAWPPETTALGQALVHATAAADEHREMGDVLFAAVADVRGGVPVERTSIRAARKSTSDQRSPHNSPRRIPVIAATGNSGP